jgi:hypothetical protein
VFFQHLRVAAGVAVIDQEQVVTPLTVLETRLPYYNRGGLRGAKSACAIGLF